jgi:hypothetical protein
MKRNQLTITYPTKDAADLQQTLQHLKATQHLISQHSAVQQSQRNSNATYSRKSNENYYLTHSISRSSDALGSAEEQ